MVIICVYSIPPPKLHYADIDCLLTEDRGFVPNLLCYRGEWQRDITTLRGEDCVDFFISHLDDYAHPPDENIEVQPRIIVLIDSTNCNNLYLLIDRMLIICIYLLIGW